MGPLKNWPYIRKDLTSGLQCNWFSKDNFHMVSLMKTPRICKTDPRSSFLPEWRFEANIATMARKTILVSATGARRGAPMMNFCSILSSLLSVWWQKRPPRSEFTVVWWQKRPPRSFHLSSVDTVNRTINSQNVHSADLFCFCCDTFRLGFGRENTNLELTPTPCGT